MTEFDDVILATDHPYYKRVADVTSRILKSNVDIPEVKEKKWTITVVENPEKNAMVLPVID